MVRAGGGGNGLRAALYCAILLAGFVGRSWAGFEGEVGVEGTWTDNLYLTASSEEDFVTVPFGHASVAMGEHFSLRYRLNGYLYNSNSELNALRQRASVRHDAKVGGSHDLGVEFGYGGILHGGDSENLDHHQLGGTVDLNLRPSPGLLIVPGVEGYWRTYPDTDDLDYAEAIGNLLVNRSFDSGTTLRLTGTLFFRRFLNPFSDSVQAEDAANSQVNGGAPSPVSASGGMNPAGSGFGGSGSGPGQAGGNRWGGSDSAGEQGPAAGAKVERNIESRSAGQFLAAVRLARALGSRAGFFVEGSYRKNFLDPPRFAEGSIPGLDREFFDDHYGYEGPGASAQVSLLLPLSGMRMVLIGLLEERRYAGREALDLDGNLKDPAGEERRDERYEIAVRGEFSRDFGKAFPAAMSADLGYSRVWNESNDDWYDTGENRVFASLSLLW